MNSPPLDKVRWWNPGGYPSAGGFNAVLKAARSHQSALQADGILTPDGVFQRRRLQPVLPPNLGIVTASTLISGHQAQWYYTIQPVTVSADREALVDVGIATITATNLTEFAHESEPASNVPWYVWGVDCHQDGMILTPLPVGGGAANGSHVQDVLVTFWDMAPHETLEPLWVFDRVGSFHAECE